VRGAAEGAHRIPAAGKVHDVDPLVAREPGRHDDAGVVAALLGLGDRGIVVPDADPDGLGAGESARSHPFVESLPQLGDAVRAIRATVTHVGNVVGRDLFDVHAHECLLDSFVRSIGRATGRCFAAVANLFAWLALPRLAIAPSLGAATAPLGGAHAE